MSYVYPVALLVSAASTSLKRTEGPTLHILGDVGGLVAGDGLVEDAKEYLGLFIAEPFERLEVVDGVGAGDGALAVGVVDGVALRKVVLPAQRPRLVFPNPG